MKALELATYIRFKTRTTTTTFPDSQMLPLVKFRQDELARKLMKALNTDEDIFLTPQYANLVASSVSDITKRSYSFPSDILSRIKRVEAKLDGTNFIKLYPMDLNEYADVHDETVITNNFNNYQYSTSNQSGARYDVLRKSLFIYSGTLTAVTNGLKLWCFDYPTLITDLTDNTDDIEDDPSTTEHGFPRELHELLARGVIIDWKESREKPIALSEREQNYDKDVKAAIDTLKNGDEGREIIAQLPSAQSRGNDGSDY